MLLTQGQLARLFHLLATCGLGPLKGIIENGPGMTGAGDLSRSKRNFCHAPTDDRAGESNEQMLFGFGVRYPLLVCVT